MPPSASGRQPASLMARSELDMPTPVMATVVPKCARKVSVGTATSGMRPIVRTAAATRNRTRKPGISFHQTVLLRSDSGNCRLPNHCWNSASGTSMSVRTSFTTTA